MEIKELRAKTGMSQSQFAKYFGISFRSLQGWERGIRPPTGGRSALYRRWRTEYGACPALQLPDLPHRRKCSLLHSKRFRAQQRKMSPYFSI